MGPPRLEVVLLCFFLLISSCAGIWHEKRNSTAKPEPISVPPSQYWDGSDGEWSSFAITLSRTQTIRVFPSTSLYEVWAVSPLGCSDGWQGGRYQCEQQRGGFFDMNRSNTWVEKSPYDMKGMAIVKNYEFNKLVMNFGWEDIALGIPKSGDASKGVLQHLLVGQLNDWEFSTVGFLGLDPKPTNLTDLAGFSGGQPSLLSTLKNRSAIPSLSYSYTAGAKYKDPSTPGSLTLGGYDTTRFAGLESGGRFPFYWDVETPLMVKLLSITPRIKATDDIARLARLANLEDLANSSGYPVTGLNTTINIDSTRPYIYLPHTTCMEIASKFGLKYSGDFKYLFVNDTARTVLRRIQPSLTFEIESPRGPSQSVKITLSMDTLIQKLDYPYYGPNKTTWYIPIRPSNHTTQYVLGRTFLQEAYLQVDYEKEEFGLYPAIFPPTGTKEHLVPIYSAEEKTRSNTPISKAVIGGIATGGAALILTLIGALLCLHRTKTRRKREEKEAEDFKMMKISSPISPSTTLSPGSPYAKKGFEAMELDSSTVHESGGLPSTRAELQNDPASPIVGELDSATTAFGGFYKELKGDGDQPIIKVYYEMDASPTDSLGNTPSSTLSNSSTLVGTNGSNLPNIQDMLSPIPQTPQEYYERPRPPVRAGDRSSIPQTPLEFYGPAAMEGRAGQRGWIGRAPNLPMTSGVAAVVGAGVGAAAAVPGTGLPKVTLTPATPASPSEHERERSRWLRGHSGRRKERNSGEKDRRNSEDKDRNNQRVDK